MSNLAVASTPLTIHNIPIISYYFDLIVILQSDYNATISMKSRYSFEIYIIVAYYILLSVVIITQKQIKNSSGRGVGVSFILSFSFFL